MDLFDTVDVLAGNGNYGIGCVVITDHGSGDNTGYCRAVLGYIERYGLRCFGIAKNIHGVIAERICAFSINRNAGDLILQDAGDLNKYPSKSSVHLPLGYDEDIFFPVEVEKDIDICLVGNFYPILYQNRLDLIRKLGSDPRFTKLKISVIGSAGNMELNESLKKELPSVDFLGKMVYKDINIVLNRSKVVVNLHQNDGIEPVNPWLFMIAGTRTCQVTDNRVYLKKYFNDGTEIIMSSVTEIPEILLEVLRDELKRSQIAERSYIRAKTDHSSGSRARTIGELVN